MTEPYHLRRSEKEMTDPGEIRAVIDEAEHMTLAMCRGDEPYLATVNYAFDPASDTFYLHCATQGKKLDFLAANPRVWGQILIDDGYVDGECDHAFRTVQFPGVASRIEGSDAKAAALAIMVDQLESEPDDVKKRLIEERDLEDVLILAVKAEGFTGKKNT
jgi:nitroimidazol reductase NimA-like FMN-containing flavoprotein (pyridoxamine 5'-phosphate oxidase superfamily)